MYALFWNFQVYPVKDNKRFYQAFLRILVQKCIVGIRDVILHVLHIQIGSPKTKTDKD